MLKNLFVSISVFSWLMSAFFAISAAWFEYSSRSKNNEEKGAFKLFYSKAWQWINNNYLIHLPLLVIIRFLNFIAFIANKFTTTIERRLVNLFTFYIGGDRLNRFLRRFYIRRLLFGDYRQVYKLSFLRFIVIATSSSILFLGLFQFETAISLVVLTCILDNRLPKIRRSVVSPYRTLNLGAFFVHWTIWILQLGIISVQFLGIFYALEFLVTLNIYLLSLLLLILSPIISYVFGNTVLDIATAFSHYFRFLADNSFLNRLEERWMLSGLSISLSLTLTAMSFVIGALFCDSCSVQVTTQLLVSNLIFDALTLFLTVYLLEKSVPLINRQGAKWNLALVIMADLGGAALFAVLSIYLGVFNTPQQISLEGATRILFGLNPFNSLTYEFGPFFWAMHTTFIPTLIYLLIILNCVIGKLIIIPTNKLLFQGSKSEDPYHLSAGFFAFCAVIFTILSTGLDKIFKLVF
jgi:hypothetical protein